MSSKGKKVRGSRQKYDSQVKAAVLSALLAGQGVEQVAAEFNIPEGTVAGWKSKQQGEAPVDLSHDQRADVGQLLVEYLKENLTTLKFQQQTIFRNSEWLKSQSAAELATLHGVIADKAARLLEAMAGDHQTEKPTE